MKRKINVKLLLSSLKTITNSEDCSEGRIKIPFSPSFPAIGSLMDV
jgi:hypothetical protein